MILVIFCCIYLDVLPFSYETVKVKKVLNHTIIGHLLIEPLGYELVSEEMSCEMLSQHTTLEEAIKRCDSLGQHCEGIQDKYCNLAVIVTCIKVVPSTTYSGEGCIYVPKGKINDIFQA